MTCFTPRYLASKGKVASELMAEEVKEEEKNFLKDSYPGLMGSPVQVSMRLQIPSSMFLRYSIFASLKFTLPQVVTAMTSSSPDSVVEADVLAGELFECEDEEEDEDEDEDEGEDEEGEDEGEEEQEEEEEGARIKRQEPTPAAAADACANIGVAEPLGSFSRDSHPEGSSCYWHAGNSNFITFIKLISVPSKWAELL